MSKAELVELRIKYIPEMQPDLSHLTGHCAGPEYEAEDNARIESYNNGYWYMMGVRAEADIKVYVGKSYIIGKLSSGGLWGIESDSDNEYIQQIEQEQLEELKQELEDLGIELTGNEEILKIDGESI